MLNEIRALLVLQDRDRRLMLLDKDLEKLPRDEERARTKLNGDQAAVKLAHDALMAAELVVKKHEMDAQTRRTTILRLKQQQFETRKNEEFQALGHEITRYEKDLDTFETAELVAMEEVDRLRKIHHEAEAALVRTRSLVDEDLAGIAERGQRIRAERTEVAAERQRVAAEAPEDILPLYERLMKTKNGLALAPLEEGKCQGCHMKLIPSTVVAVQAGKEITRCEDCGRILYIEG
jgi:predicted  nucleic acid-binding Zn-ribbon protein